MLQTSCSELLVDTRIREPEEALARFAPMFARYGWESSPPLTLEMLRELKATALEYEALECVVFDQRGNRAWLHYGLGSDVESGFCLGSRHRSYDVRSFALIRTAFEHLDDAVIDTDATTAYYDAWAAGPALVIAVSLSSRCVGDCPFCYVDRSRQDVPDMVGERLLEVLPELPGAAVCFEYGGYGLAEMLDLAWRLDRHMLTMTTIPSLVTDALLLTLLRDGFIGISHSYDSAKVSDPADWVRAAEMVRRHGFTVGCNFLIEQVPFDLPEVVLAATDQLNLLALKPPGKLEPRDLEAVNLQIESLKSRVTVAVDNCLGVQLGYEIRCMAGAKFVHILSDGTLVDCCFGDKCHLWSGRQAGGEGQDAAD